MNYDEMREFLVKFAVEHGEGEVDEDGDFSGSLGDALQYFTNNEDFQGHDVIMEDEFGGEGMGDSQHIILKVTNNRTKTSQYVKFDGWYDSWNGGEMEDDFYFVEPRQVEVTQYFKI